MCESTVRQWYSKSTENDLRYQRLDLREYISFLLELIPPRGGVSVLYLGNPWPQFQDFRCWVVSVPCDGSYAPLYIKEMIRYRIPCMEICQKSGSARMNDHLWR